MSRFRKRRDDPFPIIPPHGSGWFMFGILMTITFAIGLILYVSSQT